MVNIIKQDLSEIKKNLIPFEDKIENKTFLVTGGAGFIGSWFCDILNEFNANIICVDNVISGSQKNIEHLRNNNNFKFVEKDVCEFDTKQKIDFIVHMASIASPLVCQAHPIKTLDANVIGIKRMLELAKRNEINGLLFTSTSEVYGDPLEEMLPTPETYYGFVNSFGPRCMYDEGKRCAEAYCYSFFNKFRLPIRIARIFNTYGPRLDIKSPSKYGRVVIKFIYQSLNNQPFTIYGDGTQTRSFCYINDQIIGLFKLLLTPKMDGKIINIGSDHEITILELAKRIKKLNNSISDFTFSPLPKDDPKRRRPNIIKAKQLLKWEPIINLDDGLKRTVEWVKSLQK